MPDLLRLPSTGPPACERQSWHSLPEMLERMSVGRAELELDVAAELQHLIIVALELNAFRLSSFISDMQNMLMPYPWRERSASNTKVPGNVVVIVRMTSPGRERISLY